MDRVAAVKVEAAPVGLSTRAGAAHSLSEQARHVARAQPATTRAPSGAAQSGSQQPTLGALESLAAEASLVAPAFEPRAEEATRPTAPPLVKPHAFTLAGAPVEDLEDYAGAIVDADGDMDGDDGFMGIMGGDVADADLLSLSKLAARSKCPNCAASNPATQMTCRECNHRFLAKGKREGVDGSGNSLDKLLFSSGLASAGAGGGEQACCPAEDGAAMDNLLSLSASAPEPRIRLPAGLLPGLGGDDSWDLAAKGLGGAGLNYAVADADLLTHMVPKTPPRKKCSSCHELNPTARQSCVKCGAKFLMRPKRSAAGASGEDNPAGGSRHKRELAPAAEGAPASSKLRAPRKKCSACHAFNPTAQQACQACGARFTIKSKAKQQSKANKEKEHGAALGGLQLPLGTPLALGALTSALAAGSVRMPNALGALGSVELQAHLLGSACGRQGPHVTIGPDGRLVFHDAPNSGAPLDLQAILQASSSLNSSGAPICSALDGTGASPAHARLPLADDAAPDSAGGPLALPHSAPWADDGRHSPGCDLTSEAFTGSEADLADRRFPGLIAASNSGQPSMSSAPLGGPQSSR